MPSFPHVRRTTSEGPGAALRARSPKTIARMPFSMPNRLTKLATPSPSDSVAKAYFWRGTVCSRATAVSLSMVLLHAERALGFDLEWVLPREEECNRDDRKCRELQTDGRAGPAVELEPEQHEHRAEREKRNH